MPVLGILVGGLTDVLTAANNLVEEHPGITAAIVGITTALAALAIGAVATSSVVTGTLIPALTAAFSNPVVLAVAAVGALVAALVTLDQSMEKTAAEETLWGATKRMREEADALIDSINAERQAFEELEEEFKQTAKSEESMLEELDGLRRQSELTASQQERMLYLVEKLNEAFPELGLAYDEATESLNMSTEAVSRFIETAEEEQAAAEYSARYNEVLDERAQIAEQLPAVMDALAEAGPGLAEAEANTTAIFESGGASLDAARQAYNDAKAAVEELTQADTDLMIEEDGLRESIDATNVKMGETDGVSQVACGAIDVMIGQMEALNQAYMDTYREALESIEGQFSLWDELDAVVATSAEDIKAALESQTAYWTNYADNLSNLNSRNIEGLNYFVAAVDDGSTNAAAYIAGLAQMSDEELRVLVDQTYPALIDAQNTAAEGSAEMATSYTENIDAMVTDTAEAVKAMNLSDEAKKAAADTMQGYVNGLDNGFVTREMEATAKQATASFKNELGVHSPSTVFEEIGNNTMQGYAQGVGKNQSLVVAEMETVAKLLTEKAKVTLGAPAFQEIGKITMSGIKDGISAHKADTVRTMGNAADETLNKAKTILKLTVFQEIGRGTMTGLQAGIDGGRQGVVNAMQQAANAVYNTAKTALAAEKFKSIGTSMIDGMKAGIEKGIPSLADAAKKAAKAAYEAAKKELDINSPSKKFEYLAKMSVEGYAGGWRKHTGDIDRLIERELSVDGRTGEARSRDINGPKEERVLPKIIYQTIHIHSKTDSIIEVARQFEESQREAALGW